MYCSTRKSFPGSRVQFALLDVHGPRGQKKTATEYHTNDVFGNCCKTKHATQTTVPYLKLKILKALANSSLYTYIY